MRYSRRSHFCATGLYPSSTVVHWTGASPRNGSRPPTRENYRRLSVRTLEFSTNVYKNKCIQQTWVGSRFLRSTVCFWVAKRPYVYVRFLSTYVSASVIPGACLIGVCLAKCDKTVIVPLMIVATASFGTMFSGIFSNHTDIASKYAGELHKNIIFSC